MFSPHMIFHQMLVMAQEAPTAEAGGGIPPILNGLYVFILAAFVGFEVITKVPPTLHTPLMSGANAISGITIVGALFCARYFDLRVANIIGFFAVVFAMINVVGGYLVTDRMLRMFKKKKSKG